MNITIRGPTGSNYFRIYDKDLDIGYVESDNKGFWQSHLELVDYTEEGYEDYTLEDAIESLTRMYESYTSRLFLYLVARTDSVDYDEYDSFVTVAPCSEDARHTWPSEADIRYIENQWIWNDTQKPLGRVYNWVEDPDTLEVTLLGKAGKGLSNRQNIISSFNAG